MLIFKQNHIHTHFLLHFLQMISGRGSPDALHAILPSACPATIVLLYNSCTLGRMTTSRRALASTRPAGFSAMQVYSPVSSRLRPYAIRRPLSFFRVHLEYEVDESSE